MLLTELGIEEAVAEDIVTRYGKEARRLQIDMKHARQNRVLSIRQRLESELADQAPHNSEAWRKLDEAIDALVPGGSLDLPALTQSVSGGPSPIVTITQQTFHHVEGSVIQGVQGTVNLGTESTMLLELIARFSASDAADLESAVYELEDQDAQSSDRLLARQRLKRFLFKLAGKVEDETVNLMLRYVEAKLGVGPSG